MDHAITLPVHNPRKEAVLTHAIVFAVVIALLTALDVYTGGSFWVHWVFLGWGMGVLLHAFLALRR